MRRGAILLLLAVAAATVVAFAPIGIGVAAAAGFVVLGGIVVRPVFSTQPPSPPAPTADARPQNPTTDWVDAMPCAVLLLDADLQVIRANEPATALGGGTAEEMVGLSLIRATRDHNITQIARESTGIPQAVDVRDGQTVRVVATRLAEPVGGAVHVLAFEDLTELRRAQRARSDLVANASHELRTPVTAALALAETLELGVPDEDQRLDFHRRLTSEVSRLSAIIDGLLKLSRLESQTDDFLIEPLSPSELLETAAGRIEPLLLPGQSLERLDEPTALVAGDRERVLEVLANLLDNALRASPANGTVALGASAGDGEVRFEVRDDGPGIAPRDRARVFERFYTGEDSRTDRESSGLGLAIARHIVSRMGGRIWVGDDAPGATLCFTLPLSEGVAVAAEPADEAIDTSAERVD